MDPAPEPEESPEPTVKPLPEDVILQLFSYLDPRSLVTAVQYVCRSWWRICRDPSLWRAERILVECRSDWPFLVRVLGAAPSLALLDLQCPLEGAPRELSAALRETPCCLDALVLSGSCDRDGAQDFLELLEGQLPHLRELRLQAVGSGWDDAAAHRLFLALGHAQDLHTMLLEDAGETGGVLACETRVPPRRGRHATLRRLALRGSPRLGRAPHCLVEAHAPTLVEVSLTAGAPASSVIAVARCHGLQCARLPAVSEVTRLLDCPFLTDLELYSLDMGRAGRAVMRYLKEVRGLQRLGLHDVIATREALLAIAESKSAHSLRSFCLVARNNQDDVEALVATLRRLSELQELRGSLCVALLEALTPSVAPNLRLVERHYTCGVYRPGTCALPAIRELLRRFPGLHVERFCGLLDRGEKNCVIEHGRVGATGRDCCFHSHAQGQDSQCSVCQDWRRRGYHVILLD